MKMGYFTEKTYLSIVSTYYSTIIKPNWTINVANILCFIKKTKNPNSFIKWIYLFEQEMLQKVGFYLKQFSKN